MEIVVQLCMGVGLASCAGLRAWMPLLVASLLAHGGYVGLNPSFEVLARPDTLVVLLVATIVEVLGDKLPAVDHVLDGLGAVLRPAAGTVLASAMLVDMDPLAALVLGTVTGGAAAGVVAAAKGLVRLKVSVLGLFHGGLGNAAVSTAEDGAVVAGVAASVLIPIIAAAFAVMAVFWLGWLLTRRRTPEPPPSPRRP